jgi:hypothetical protein
MSLFGDAYGATQVLEAEIIYFLKRFGNNINVRTNTVGFNGFTSADSKRVNLMLKCTEGFQLNAGYKKTEVEKVLQLSGVKGWIINKGVLTLSEDSLIGANEDAVENVFKSLYGKSVHHNKAGGSPISHGILLCLLYTFTNPFSLSLFI